MSVVVHGALFRIQDASPKPELSDVLLRLSAARYRIGCEYDLQAGVEKILQGCGVPFVREYVLSASDRPDFFIPELNAVLEVKVDGSSAMLLRQIARYTQHASVQDIVVIGTPGWIARLPISLQSKPVHSIRLLSSLL